MESLIIQYKTPDLAFQSSSILNKLTAGRPESHDLSTYTPLLVVGFQSYI